MIRRWIPHLFQSLVLSCFFSAFIRTSFLRSSFISQARARTLLCSLGTEIIHPTFVLKTGRTCDGLMTCRIPGFCQSFILLIIFPIRIRLIPNLPCRLSDSKCSYTPALPMPPRRWYSYVRCGNTEQSLRFCRRAIVQDWRDR